MKNYLANTLLVLLAILISLPCAATVPELIPVQGVLADASGVPVQGEVGMTFTFYDAQTEGQALWTDSYALDLEDGFYTVYLGSAKPLDVAAMLGSLELWLGITVGDDAEMDRVLLSAVPFALQAQACQQIGNLTEDEIQPILSGDASCADGFYLQGWDEVNGQAICVADMAGIRVENDPEFSDSEASGISAADLINWNAAHAWGDHAAKGYLTSFTEIDPGWNSDKGNYFTSAELAGDGSAQVHWNNLENLPLGFADNTDDGLTSESDPIWTAASSTVQSDIDAVDTKADDNTAAITTLNSRQRLTDTDTGSLAITSYNQDIATGMALNVQGRGRDVLMTASINVDNTVGSTDTSLRFYIRFNGIVRRTETVVLKADSRQIVTLQWLERALTTATHTVDIIVNATNRVNIENRYLYLIEL